MAAGKLFIDMRHAQFRECPVQRTVRINERILGPAIEADGRKRVIIHLRPVQQIGVNITRILKCLRGERNELRQLPCTCDAYFIPKRKAP